MPKRQASARKQPITVKDLTDDGRLAMRLSSRASRELDAVAEPAIVRAIVALGTSQDGTTLVDDLIDAVAKRMFRADTRLNSISDAIDGAVVSGVPVKRIGELAAIDSIWEYASLREQAGYLVGRLVGRELAGGR